MRVLLYEPARGGHHETILGYAVAVLRDAGHSPIVVADSLASTGDELGELHRLAIAQQCDLVHVLTADGCGRRWLRELRRVSVGSPRTVPLVATYYLYDNLAHSVRGAAWDVLVASGRVDRVLISDDTWRERMIPPWRAAYVRLLPDPWNPTDFVSRSRDAACAELGLDSKRTRFLLFGDLSARKGVDLVLHAYEQIASDSTELMLAGEWHRELNGTAAEKTLERLIESGRARIEFGYVEEAAVAAYFFASDYVLCAYPASFAVSSGTFTRALASGRPAIVAAHGAIGRKARDAACALRFETGSSPSLAESMRRAIALVGSPSYHAMADRGRAIAGERTLERFGQRLLAAYRELLEHRRSESVI
jgi:glycosyltransferase involved in cell wall biosynthesis